MEVTAGEEWKSPDTGAEADPEGSRTGAGQLACSEEPPGHAGSGESGIFEKDWRKAKGKEHIKRVLKEVRILGESNKVLSEEELDQMERVLATRRKVPMTRITVENLDEIKEQLDEVLHRCEAIRHYGKMADCIIQHVKTFHKQAFHEETADFGEPCASCRHRCKCNHDWLSIMTPVFLISAVEFHMPDLQDSVKTDATEVMGNGKTG